MNEWQPIETAPTKGQFLVFIPTSHTPMQVCCMRKVANGTIKIIGNHNVWDMDEPTHWMPLPGPPA